MRCRAFGALVLGSICLLAGGCHNVDREGSTSTGVRLRNEESRSSELQRNQFVDIPVPEKMQLVTRHNDSFSFYRGGVRLARLTYWTADLGIEEVVSFYRDTMTQRPFGWAQSAERTEDETHVLTYQKDSERCEITVKRDNRGTAALIKLNVD